jgi:hypothetical protein
MTSLLGALPGPLTISAIGFGWEMLGSFISRSVSPLNLGVEDSIIKFDVVKFLCWMDERYAHMRLIIPAGDSWHSLKIIRADEKNRGII